MALRFIDQKRADSGDSRDIDSEAIGPQGAISVQLQLNCSVQPGNDLHC